MGLDFFLTTNNQQLTTKPGNNYSMKTNYEANPSSKSNQPTVLTIYAYADDEVLPAAGTLRLMSDAGWNVRSLILTDGNLSSSSIKDKRHQEAEAAGKLIGATYEFYALLVILLQLKLTLF